MTSTAAARYDDVAEFYAEGWGDDVGDTVSQTLLRLLGPVRGRTVVDLACGHGRFARELARLGAETTGLDLSAALLGRAEAAERREPLGIRYLRADAADPGALGEHAHDAVLCSFGLSDIDDLDGALAAVARALRPGGVFAFSILHPCYPGGNGSSGAWPADGRYFDEGWWRADGAKSTLRQQVGANHRTLSTYLNALRRNGLFLEETAEPMPDPGWAAARPTAARHPVFLVARCRTAERRTAEAGPAR